MRIFIFNLYKVTQPNLISMQVTYDSIANSFSSTRFAIWNCVGQFLDSLPQHSTLLDVGCGNGKYSRYRKDIIWFGCDISRELLKIAQTTNSTLVQASITRLPFKHASFDCAISIAVIHHLKTEQERLQAIEQIMQVTRHKALVTVWAREQQIKPKWQDMGNGDFLIPWQNTALRYYHLFTKQEIESLLSRTGYKYTLSFEKDNWCAIVYKNILS